MIHSRHYISLLEHAKSANLQIRKSRWRRSARGQYLRATPIRRCGRGAVSVICTLGMTDISIIVSQLKSSGFKRGNDGRLRSTWAYDVITKIGCNEEDRYTS